MLVEGEPVEFLLDLTSRVEVVLGFEEHGLDELVEQLGGLSQLEVDSDR